MKTIGEITRILLDWGIKPDKILAVAPEPSVCLWDKKNKKLITGGWQYSNEFKHCVTVSMLCYNIDIGLSKEHIDDINVSDGIIISTTFPNGSVRFGMITDTHKDYYPKEHIKLENLI